MKTKEELEFEEFITFMEKVHTHVGDKITKREEGWDTFLSLIDEVQGDVNLWKKTDFQKRVHALCTSIDCRLLDAKSWETTDELELLAQLSIRDSSEDEDFEDDILDEDNSEEEEEEEKDIENQDEDDIEDFEDSEESVNFTLDPDFFDVALDEFKMIAPKDVLGFFVLLDRYIEFYAGFLKESEYSLLLSHLPENPDGTIITSELK